MLTKELSERSINWLVRRIEFTKPIIIGNSTIMALNENDVPAFYNPSANWAHGGPIIERERILVQPEVGKEGCANAWSAISMKDTEAYGPTPLIAAMRCFIASHLGDDVQVPEELR